MFCGVNHLAEEQWSGNGRATGHHEAESGHSNQTRLLKTRVRCEFSRNYNILICRILSAELQILSLTTETMMLIRVLHGVYFKN